MKTSDEKWDIRCPDKLHNLFPTRRGYYYRVNHATAGKVLEILSDAYSIPSPKIENMPKSTKEYAAYDYDRKVIQLKNRNHLKSIFHEFYHHLDNMTDGMYNSDDRDGGSSSLAWLFAEELWKKFAKNIDKA